MLDGLEVVPMIGLLVVWAVVGRAPFALENETYDGHPSGPHDGPHALNHAGRRDSRRDACHRLCNGRRDVYLYPSLFPVLDPSLCLVLYSCLCRHLYLACRRRTVTCWCCSFGYSVASARETAVKNDEMALPSY